VKTPAIEVLCNEKGWVQRKFATNFAKAMGSKFCQYNNKKINETGSIQCSWNENFIICAIEQLHTKLTILF